MRVRRIVEIVRSATRRSGVASGKAATASSRTSLIRSAAARTPELYSGGPRGWRESEDAFERGVRGAEGDEFGVLGLRLCRRVCECGEDGARVEKRRRIGESRQRAVC